MRIKFACEHCGQRLTVSGERAGGRAQCPQCKRPTAVPQQGGESPATPLAPSATPRGATAGHENPDRDEPSFDEFSVFDFDTELVYESDARAAESSPQLPVDYTKLAVSRRIVYLQGGLLFIVALFCLTLGILIGRTMSSGEVSDAGPRPCVISGTIRYRERGSEVPDFGSVVIAVPEDARPEASQKIPIATISPTLSAGDVDQSAAAVRNFGGDMTRVKPDGSFSLQVPQRGAYFLLVLSRHAALVGADLNREDQAQIERYFSPAEELLRSYRYDWRRADIRRRHRLEVVF